ncbi:MAG: hypothetical protein AAGI28_08310 [Pseudomonadota bacterium]
MTKISDTAAKLYADVRGTQSEAPLSDTIEIGLFSEEPIGRALAIENVSLGRRPKRGISTWISYNGKYTPAK